MGEALTIRQDKVFASFLCVPSLLSDLGSEDLTSRTSNIYNILPPCYHTYFQQIAIVVFKSCQAIFDLRLPLCFLLLDSRS